MASNTSGVLTVITDNMCGYKLTRIYLLALWCGVCVATAPLAPLECGPYGFVCEGRSRVRLCEGAGPHSPGPAFLCPAGTLCSEASPAVCEDVYSYMGPALRGLRCRRAERLPDPATPGCKGYVLCIPNRARFQGVRYTCAGDTVFNALTRACTAPQHYTCPHTHTHTNTTHQEQEQQQQEPPSRTAAGAETAAVAPRPIDCKDYRLSAAQSGRRPLYFCPARPPRGAPPRCTVFSDHFCIILERDPRDTPRPAASPPYREPRTYNNTSPSIVARRDA